MTGIDFFKPCLNAAQKAKLSLLLDAVACAMGDRPWMLYGGSLLGAVLWGDLLPWDDDIDVITTVSPAYLDFRPFSAIRKDYGPNLLMKVFDPLDPKVSQSEHGFPFIDLSMMHCSGQFVVHASTQGGVDRFPYDVVFPLRQVPFGLGHAMIPNNPVALLKMKYGPDCFTSARAPVWDHQHEQFTGFANTRMGLHEIVRHFAYPPFREIN